MSELAALKLANTPPVDLHFLEVNRVRIRTIQELLNFVKGIKSDERDQYLYEWKRTLKIQKLSGPGES